MSLQIKVLGPPALPSAATIVTLSRPAAGNALGEAMIDELNAALGQPPLSLCFAARAAISALGSTSATSTRKAMAISCCASRGSRVCCSVSRRCRSSRLRGQGRTIGAGADLFAACDHRLCLPGATFAFPGAAFGLVLGNRRLAARIGRERARDLLMSGRAVSAEEAMQTGLVTAIVEQERVEAVIADAAQMASRLDAATLRAMRAATLAEEPDRDMSALVRSAMRPGLGKRISDYAASRRTPDGKLSPAP